MSTSQQESITSAIIRNFRPGRDSLDGRQKVDDGVWRKQRNNRFLTICMAGWLGLAALTVTGLSGCSDGGARLLREERTHELGQGKRAGETKTIALPGGAAMEMVWCPPGTFMMGSPETEEGRTGRESRSHNEKRHPVTLTRGFWMAKTEVTQKQWQSVMEKNPSKFKGDDLPVDSIHWFDCRKFCGKTGLLMPTEAEWEYACRAGTTRAYAGTGRLDDMGWYSGNSGKQTHAVGQKLPNAWGLYDMHGNVSEWCEDYVDAYPEKAMTNPTGPVTLSGAVGLRSVRGGNWDRKAADCRSADRGGASPRDRYPRNGFRPIVREE